jgi:bifunctional DNase/RNase
MILMHIRDITFCPQHNRGLIVLEDTEQSLRLAFNIHPDVVPSQARGMKGAQHSVHPVYDFIQLLLDAFLATPTDVVLDDVPHKGLMAFVQVHRAGTMLSLPCYAPAALALAIQTKTPIYATIRALAHAEPQRPAASPLNDEGDVQAWLARVKPTDFRSQPQSDA